MAYNIEATETTLEKYNRYYENSHPSDCFSKLLTTEAQVMEGRDNRTGKIRKDITELLWNIQPEGPSITVEWTVEFLQWLYQPDIYLLEVILQTLFLHVV